MDKPRHRKIVRGLWGLTVGLLIAASVSGLLIIAAWGLAMSAVAAAVSINVATKRAVQENRREIELAYKHGRRVSMREHT